MSSFGTVSGAVESSIAMKIAVILLPCLKLLAVSRIWGKSGDICLTLKTKRNRSFLGIQDVFRKIRNGNWDKTWVL